MKNIAITKTVQDSLMPNAVLADLMQGNERFINNNMDCTASSKTF